MNKILVVCLGNICRSPLAEGIFLHLVKEKGLSITIDSAGTSDYHIDECPDHRTIKNARKHNIDLSPLRARQFCVQDFDDFDRIFVMDKSNLSNVLRLARHDEDRKKVDLLLNVLHPGKHLEVPDPYFGGEQGFEDVFQMVYKACNALLDSLAQRKS
jgi:protein-tyrosine phosphatase